MSLRALHGSCCVFRVEWNAWLRQHGAPVFLHHQTMSRWRPPAPASTAVITREGFERLRAELDELWRQRRPEVVKAMAAAAAVTGKLTDVRELVG